MRTVIQQVCGVGVAALIAGLAFPSVVMAQAAPTVGPGSEDADTPPTDDGVIVVTARRRAEDIQDVPVSVTAFSQDTLTTKGIVNAYDLGAAVPSLGVTTAGSRSNAQYSLRGQRTNETQILTDPPVGLYFAEVNQPRTIGFGTAFYDLANIQVLKGVQGTLFGRNNTGGAILVEPARPTRDFGASVTGQLGNYNLRDIEGMINLPLGDVAAFRIAGKYRKRDGFIIDQSNGRDYSNENYHTFRASLLLDPTDSVSNLTIFDYLNSDDHSTGVIGDFSVAAGALGAYGLINAAYAGAFGGTPNTPGNRIPNSPAFGSFAGLAVFSPVSNIAGQIAAQQAIRNSSNPYRFLGTAIGSGGPFDYPLVPGGGFSYERTKNWGITNKTTLDLGGATLKNIFGYRTIKFDQVTDLGGLPAPLINSNQYKDIEELSEELQIQGNALSDNLQYTAGLYYFVEKGDDGSTSLQFPELRVAFDPRPTSATASARLSGFRGRGTATSDAAYGAFTYALSDQFKFSAGLRYTHDKREVHPAPVGAPNLSTCTFDTTGTTLSIAADCSVAASKSWNALTYDATLQWEPNDGTNAYASFRKGYRAGGFSLRASDNASITPFEPETVFEYELGLKNKFNAGGGVLTTSAALFYQDYRNVQVQDLSVNNRGLVVTVISNVNKQRILGGELEANLQVGNFDAGINYSYVDVKVLETKPSLANVFPQVGLPKHQVNANIGWHLPIGSGNGDLVASGTLSFKSAQFLDDKDIGAKERAYTLVNARLSWDNVLGSNFNAALFVQNLTKTFYRVGVVGIVAETGIGASAYGAPRTYGLSIGYKF